MIHGTQLKVKLDAWRHVPAWWLILRHVLVLESRDTMCVAAVFNALWESRSRRRREWGRQTTWPLYHVTWLSAQAQYLKTQTHIRRVVAKALIWFDLLLRYRPNTAVSISAAWRSVCLDCWLSSVSNQNLYLSHKWEVETKQTNEEKIKTRRKGLNDFDHTS